MLTSHDSAQELVQATEIHFADSILLVSLSDGRTISLPVDKIEWLRWLAEASPEQRDNWSIEPGGYAVYWNDLDDGIELMHLLGMQPLV
jgi:hypothetical protein